MNRRDKFYCKQVLVLTPLSVIIYFIAHGYVTNVFGAIAAYFWPNIIPNLKGLSYRNPLLAMRISLILLIAGLFTSLCFFYRPFGLISIAIWGIVYTYYILVSSENFPDDERKGFFNSDKIKALVARVAEIHNVPKPSPA